jgi:hypothetical protein
MKGTFFEAAMLDDRTKEELCRELLSEFGVSHIRKTDRGELIHSCCLPFGGHKNGDRNPSASLNYQKLTYRCLGCGGGGGLLWFIAVCQGVDGVQARRWLEGQTGTGQQVMDLSKLLQILNGFFDHATEEIQQVPVFPDATLKPWTWEVFHPYLTEGVPEIGFKGRGIPESTLKHFKVGYAEEYSMGFHTGPDGELIPNPPQERIVIPLWWQDKLVGWQARRLNRGDEPKYKNSQDFPRDKVLYNYRPGEPMVLVESPMSVLRHYHVHQGLVASFGAAISKKQLSLLGKANPLIIWMDNDKAGWDATQHVIEELSRSTSIFVVENPYDADPADLDEETVDHLIKTATPWALWKPPETLKVWEGRQ